MVKICGWSPRRRMARASRTIRGPGGMVEALGLDHGQGHVVVEDAVMGQVDALLSALSQELLYLIATVRRTRWGCPLRKETMRHGCCWTRRRRGWEQKTCLERDQQRLDMREHQRSGIKCQHGSASGQGPVPSRTEGSQLLPHRGGGQSGAGHVRWP